MANAKYEFTGETKIFFGVTLNRIRARAREGRQALATYKTPFWEGLAVALFIAAMPLAMVLS